jgi:hypothetical protein
MFLNFKSFKRRSYLQTWPFYMTLQCFKLDIS